ncbi:hypothetical protein LWP59_03030 [Amycolatopsis acidiphila]|uniref:Uncharacterized protein n=1 Tax=Amycolatopsis acidiphila TaxID=715473 RepID=A0A558A0U1_9PSEU|nr:hypothetical protein [Amycolatopsis acidiphila]TVT17883.1 hypothetical protein FNH06_29595 [Amycolatopsis acidiphila]UIJ60673.1 hypothetical protein LWP59_03030 [Amycolatopsis acidiphila]GHG91510.1 hypothetical protein GCM10017788_67840 [Amycolatopsis acidiphila]
MSPGREDDRIGGCHPADLGLLRIHVDGLHGLAEHEQRPGEPGPLDRRRDAVLWTRRLGERTPAAPGLPAACRLPPAAGGVLHLCGRPHRHLPGTVAPEVTVAIERGCAPGRRASSWTPSRTPARPPTGGRGWLREQIIEPLQPTPESA